MCIPSLPSPPANYLNVLVTLLLISSCLADQTGCPSSSSSVESTTTRISGDTVAYTCTIRASESQPLPATVWYLPKPQCSAGGIVLSHKQEDHKDGECGPFNATTTAMTMECYTSVLSFYINPGMAGKDIECIHNSLTSNFTVPPVSAPLVLKANYSLKQGNYFVNCFWNMLPPIVTGTESGNITLDQYTAHEFISGNELGTVSAADACTDGDRCFHSFPIEDCVAEKVCQIYLIATGSKENRIVTSNMESIMLNIKMLSASVKLKYPKIVATCTFNKWFDGKTWCMLEVSLTQGSFKRSATSEKKGSAERSVMVELQLDSEIFDVHPGTVYYYRVSLVDTEYNVTGNITVTGCNISDLGELRKPGDSGDQEECAEGETPLFISGGTVCYNGTSPGSTAVYHCGEGYWLVNGEKTRECQTSGEWSQNSSCMSCSVSDLGDTVINGNPSVCDALEIPLFIKGGTVCYNGTTPGSTAVYHCENGIEGYRVLKCQNSGEWDNKTECKPDHAEGGLSTGAILNMVVCVITFIFVCA